MDEERLTSEELARKIDEHTSALAKYLECLDAKGVLLVSKTFEENLTKDVIDTIKREATEFDPPITSKGTNLFQYNVMNLFDDAQKSVLALAAEMNIKREPNE